MSNMFVCVMGIGVVFLSLICIVIICKIMSFVLKPKSVNNTNIPVQAVGRTESIIENKQEILAAVCAVIAHETGAEAKNIRVKSFRKIS